MNLLVNALMTWETGEIERVLRLDNTDVITIEVQNNTALPQRRLRPAVEEALAQGTLQILETDAFVSLTPPEAELTEKERQYRDEAWELIRPLVEPGKDSIYAAHQRGPLVAERSAQTGKSKTTIYGYLRRYWQGGQILNALLPAFHARGGRGKNKADSGRKRGSPNRSGQVSGVNVNDHIRECFRKGMAVL